MWETPDGFALDLDGIRRAITPRTRLLVLNDPANPTGSDCSQAEIERVAELCLQHDLYVLSDEAYFDIRYEGPSLSIASLPDMAERTVILYTFSKKFAATGWRLGAAIGPRPVIDVIAKLNVNAESCSNHFVQYAMLEGLTGDQSGPLSILRTLRERRDAAASILNAMPGIRCFAPRTTLLPVARRDRSHAAQGLLLAGRLPQGGAARNPLLGMRPPSLRPARPERNAALRPAGLFRHRHGGHPRRIGPLQILA